VFGHVVFFVGGEAAASNEEAHESSVTQQPLGKGVTIMGGKTDVVKGKIKEVAGALTGNDRLRAEGNADQAVGKVKQAAAKVAGKVKKALK
jgi:uncharacterized protein YjbJ (UPF0337 family)